MRVEVTAQLVTDTLLMTIRKVGLALLPVHETGGRSDGALHPNLKRTPNPPRG